MLLPDIYAAPAAARGWVATVQNPGRVIGAAAVIEDRAAEERLLVDLHVVPPFRHQGIGKSLLKSVIHHARSVGIANLDLWQTPSESDVNLAVYDRLGFRILKTIYEFESDDKETFGAIEKLYQRVKSAGRIPANAKVIPLSQANPVEVMALHTQYLGGTEATLRLRMQGNNQLAFDPFLSVALIIDEKLMGLALAHTRSDPTIFEFDSLVMHPDVRNTWATVLLRYEVSKRGIKRGCTRARYMTFDKQLGERHSTAKVANQLIQTSLWLRMNVDENEDESGKSI